MAHVYGKVNNEFISSGKLYEVVNENNMHYEIIDDEGYPHLFTKEPDMYGDSYKDFIALTYKEFTDSLFESGSYKLEPEDIIERMNNADVLTVNYKNPFVLGYLYYTEGMSTLEMADMLSCEERTIRRYMNYFGMQRFTKRFSLLVHYHGLEEAKEITEPEYMPLGRTEIGV